MAKTALNTIKSWFRTALKPTQQQFWDTWDSFWHKDEKLPVDSVDGLDGILSEKADQSVLNNHINDQNAHGVGNKVDKVEGKGLSTEDFTTEYREKLDGLSNFNPEGIYEDLEEQEAALSEHIDDMDAHGLNNKVDKVEGKGLSTEDFTTEYREKLENSDKVHIREINDNTVLDNTYRNCIVRITDDCTITIPNVLSNDFNCVFDSDGGIATFEAGSGVTLSAPHGQILALDNMCTLYRREANSFRLNGGLI